MNPHLWSSAAFVSLCLGFTIIVFAVIAFRWRPSALSLVAPPPAVAVAAAAGSLDAVQIAWLTGGRRRAADAVLVGMVETGDARIRPPGRLTVDPEPIEIVEARGDARDPQLATCDLPGGSMGHASFADAVRPRVDAGVADLERLSVLRSAAERKRMWLEVGLAAAALGALGLLRNSHDDAIVAFVHAVALLGLFERAGRTALGHAVVAHLRTTPRPSALTAFALDGETALRKTSLAEVGRLLERVHAPS